VFNDRIATTMARRDTFDQVIALQSRSSSTQEDETESGANEHNADLVEYTEQISLGRVDSGKKRACVLLGSAILQFPIWGKFLSWTCQIPCLPDTRLSKALR
jgi:hypothetical protein